MTVRYVLLLLVGCYGAGGYKLPDGGPVPHDGAGCSCSEEIGLQVYDSATNETLVECVPTGTTADRDPTTVCLGAFCCQWKERG